MAVKEKHTIIDESIQLLKELIRIPSYSRQEDKAADLLEGFFRNAGIPATRKKNNVITKTEPGDQNLPVILLNSHIDTVKPGESWTQDPFSPLEKEGCLYGLGSNDAGGSLVSLLAVFRLMYTEKNLPFQLIFTATAEEEVSGKNGIEWVLKELPDIELAIVGEPTQMTMAIAEKGLMVLDCEATGKTGHAARDEGVNAIYKAIQDIEKIKNYTFPEKSNMLGDVKMTVTQINSGYQHNVVPDKCSFVVDVRSNECYSNKAIYERLSEVLNCKIKARSFRLNSSGIDLRHPIVKNAQEMGIRLFGSPTMSDQALIPYPSVKMGPGISARSHTPDEYIRIEEIREAVDIYYHLLKQAYS